MGEEEVIPGWIGDRVNPAWLVSSDGLSEQGREWIETPEGMEWFCSREGEWWARNRPPCATSEEVVRLSALPQNLAMTHATALKAKLCSLSGSNAVLVGWLPEQRFFVRREAIHIYGRVGLIVLDDQTAGSAGQ